MVTVDELREKFNNLPVPQSITSEETVQLLQQLLPDIQKFLDKKDETNFGNRMSSNEYESLIDLHSPSKGIEVDEIFDILKNKLIPHFKYESVNFFGFIPRSPSHISMVAESLVPFFSRPYWATIG